MNAVAIWKKFDKSNIVKIINLSPFGRKYNLKVGYSTKKQLVMQYKTLDSTHCLWQGMLNEKGEKSPNFEDGIPYIN
jgi:hypothetical protein